MGITAWQLKKPEKSFVGADNLKTDLMIICEDQQGEPFIGQAGQLLDAMLQAIGFERSHVYITNIRDAAKQIALVQPKLLLAVGQIAAHFLLDNKLALDQLRGKIHTYEQMPLIITYHPADLLQNPLDKRKAFQDLQFVLESLKTLL